MIRRSEFGPRCTHCGNINPTATIAEGGPPGMATCIHCKKPFSYWIEKLPFYCTDDGRTRCDCDVCTGKAEPSEEVPPNG
jgi:hypothetical protein